MFYDIKGKIALVTGGANGIGLCYVKELLKNGAKGITIADLDDTTGKMVVTKLTEEFGQKKVIFVKTDVTNRDQLEATFKKTAETWKTIDIVINNAGIFNDAKWELEIDINVNAVVRGTLLGMQYMRKDGGGKGGVIVNVSSIFGLDPTASSPIYAATKHFVIGLSRSLGTPYHYKNTGIKIVTICPGLTHTAMPAAATQNALKTLASDIAEHMDMEYKDLPGQPAETVACAVITLITKGENGSVWVSEGDEPVYEINIPDRRALRKS